MADVNWALGMNYPNPGIAFANAFEAGQQKKREEAQRSALAALAMNPNDPSAQASAAQFNPQMVMQARSQAQEQQQALIERHRENIVKGAQLIRQLKPQDQAGWDQARAIAAQAGIDMSEVPAQFDPQYIQGIVGLADALAPQSASNGPTSFQEYQRAQADPNYARFLEQRRGPLIANNGDGTFTIIPRPQMGGQGGPQVGTIEDGYRFKGGNPADPNAWEPVGGAGGNASGGFPGPN